MCYRYTIPQVFVNASKALQVPAEAQGGRDRNVVVLPARSLSWQARGRDRTHFFWSANSFLKTAVVHQNGPQRGSNGIRSVPTAAGHTWFFASDAAAPGALPYLGRAYCEPENA